MSQKIHKRYSIGVCYGEKSEDEFEYIEISVGEESLYYALEISMMQNKMGVGTFEDYYTQMALPRQS